MWVAAEGEASELAEFRAVLRRYRLAANLTQEALAERASISVRAIQNLERGERRPYPDTTQRLIEALDLQPAERASFERAARPQPRERRQTRPLPTNLQIPLTACIGRDAELAALTEAIAQQRLVTLVGPGGAGKTRLALKLAADLPSSASTRVQVADGIWFVELDSVVNPALVPQALAEVLGVREERGRPIEATLADLLQRRSTLLVLDNCEHVLAACERLVETLLSRCPEVRILATSRQPLGVLGEVVHQLGPLALPPVNSEPEYIEAYAAIRLFLERARAAVPALSLSPDDLRLVAAICRQLDGIPLALELAAARLRGLSLGDLAARLDEPFRLLTSTGQRRARQQSLRAAIDWSYELLDANQRCLLRRLAVFSGGWTLDAAEAVCGADAAIGLAQLVDHSLVALDRRGAESPRYRLLETVRQYAVERLAEDDALDAARDAHLSYYLKFAKAAEAGLDGWDQLTWLKQLDAEQANLRGALESALSDGHGSQALCLAAALGTYWDARGERSVGLAYLERGLHTAEAASSEVRAKALTVAGRLAFGVRGDQAARWAEQARALYAQLDDSRGVIHALLLLGQLHIETGALDAAIAYLEQAREQARQTEDRRALALVNGALGQARLDQCDYGCSVPLLQSALELFRQLGDRFGQARALQHLAMAMLETGDEPAAEAALEEAQVLLRVLGDVVGVAWTYHDLGRLALDAGRPDQAEPLFERSLNLFRALGDATGVAWSVHNVGRARLAQGRLDDTNALFEEGLALFRRLGHSRGAGWALYNLAWVGAEQGCRGTASSCVRAGLAIFHELDFTPGLSCCLVAGARMLVDERPEEAARWLGIADQMHTAEATLRAPGDCARAAQVACLARERISEAAFSREWAAGFELSATHGARALTTTWPSIQGCGAHV